MVAFTTPAFAVVVVDPDAFAAGTVLNNAFPGVTLTAVGDGGVLLNSNVLSLTDPAATTGTRVFGDTSGSPAYWGDGSFSYLEVSFASGATWVSLDFAANDSFDTSPFLRAFDAGNNVVAFASHGAVALGVPVTLTVSAPNIAYVRASWDEVGRAHNGVLDNLNYEPVPEPSTLLALSGGLAALAARRRRRK
jgi:hypothetical protein